MIEESRALSGRGFLLKSTPGLIQKLSLKPPIAVKPGMS